MSKAPNNLQLRRNCTLTTEDCYNGKTINTNKEKEQSCIEEILKPINTHLEDMREKHSQVCVVRFDLRTPNGTEELNHKQVGRIFDDMRRSLERKKYAGGHNPDPRFIGVQENQEHGTHYHCVALVNGNAIQNPNTIYQTAEKYLANSLGIPQEEATGLVDYCSQNGKNGVTIKRGSLEEQENVNKVMYQASYLAKKRGKENTPKGQHLWVGTRVPKKD